MCLISLHLAPNKKISWQIFPKLYAVPTLLFMVNMHISQISSTAKIYNCNFAKLTKLLLEFLQGIEVVVNSQFYFHEYVKSMKI